jgi:FlaA1/EpsC-like NDP-sugar epimerase
MGLLCRLYKGRWRVGSFDEVAALARAAAATTVLIFLANLALGRPMPLSVPVGGGAMALVGTAGSRCVWRLLIERHRRPKGDRCTPMVVFGAGEGGAQVLTAMLRHPNSRYLPVALLDDDPRKRHLRIMQVAVMGTPLRRGGAGGRHPHAHHGRPPGPPRDRHRHRLHRRLRHR